MKHEQMWNQLQEANLVSGEQPEFFEEEESLWYIRALQGFAGWLAALFLIGFLGFGVAGLFDNGAALIIMGLVVNFSSYVYFKSKSESDFFEQLVLVFSLTGQFLFVFGLFELFEFRNRQWILVVAVYQCVLVWVVNHWLHRFLSTWFAVIALFWGLEWLIYTGLGSALLATLFVWLWLDKTGWQASKQLYEPIAYALALALLQFNLPRGFGMGSLFWSSYSEPTWLMLNGHLISAALSSLVLIYFVYRMTQEHAIDLATTSGKLIVLAGVILLFSALPILGLSSALLVLLVGFARNKLFLQVLGVLSLLGFVGWYYYSLNTTLLNKSLILMVAGLVLLAGFVLLRKVYSVKSQIQNKNAEVVKRNFGWQKLAAFFTLTITLIGVNHAIVEKESLLDDGQSVYLELAPVDPRSLMQGDYMSLRFDMANKIRNSESFKNDWDSVVDGFAIVDIKDNGVGVFNAIYQNQSLKQNQVLMQFRKRKGRIQFATNAFFFQEGDAQLFDQAKYGEFKVSTDGELLLKAMYDNDLKLLGENRLD